MSRFGTHYQVARPTGICAASGEPLEPGTTCVATLCEREEDEGFDRLDFTLEAWDGGARPERLFSHWRMVVPAAQERRNLLVDDAVLVDLFERLADDERPQRRAFRFILALILMRKRELKFVGRRTEPGSGGEAGPDGAPEVEYWLMRQRGADPDAPPIEVGNPQLSDDDVRELTAQLSEILQSELT
ncbi:MAG: hypothetical protein ACYTF9_00375 [Planctomycetota bacterium]|jgi:hypothetical protein